MVTFPLVEPAEKIDAFFKVIRTAGVPRKFTYRYLAEIGFASSSERSLIPLLKNLNFIDVKGFPTEDYLRLLDSTTFTQVIREKTLLAYEVLFGLDNNVTNVSDDVLGGYFSRLLGTEFETSANYARTFRVLCALGDAVPLKKAVKSNVPTFSPNLNLSINLPSTTDERVYETLFKHLKDLLTPQE